MAKLEVCTSDGVWGLMAYMFYSHRLLSMVLLQSSNKRDEMLGGSAQGVSMDYVRIGLR